MNVPDGHVPEELLAAFALGERSAGDEGQHAHVEECAQCAAEIAALRETVVLASVGSEDELVPPPAWVWEAVDAQLDAQSDAQSDAQLGAELGGEAGAGGAGGAEGADASAGTSGSVVDLARPRTSQRRARGSQRRAHRFSDRVVAAVAAVALLAGAGVGAFVARLAEDDASAPVAQRLGDAQLTTVDEAALPRGTAELQRHDDRVVLHVRAAGLGDAAEAGGGTREVWLINVDGKRMVSLGLLAPGETGDFPVPERLLGQGYRIVDISDEPDDGDPLHSGQSLARGTIEG